MVTAWTGTTTAAAAKTDGVGDIGGLLDYGDSVGLKRKKQVYRHVQSRNSVTSCHRA